MEQGICCSSHEHRNVLRKRAESLEFALLSYCPRLNSDSGNERGLEVIATTDSRCAVFKGGNQRSLDESLVDLWNRRDSLFKAGRLARKSFEERHSPDIRLKFYLEIARDRR